jgi:hypothetical protein
MGKVVRQSQEHEVAALARLHALGADEARVGARVGARVWARVWAIELARGTCQTRRR